MDPECQSQPRPPDPTPGEGGRHPGWVSAPDGGLDTLSLMRGVQRAAPCMGLQGQWPHPGLCKGPAPGLGSWVLAGLPLCQPCL